MGEPSSASSSEGRSGHHAGFGCAIFAAAAAIFLGIVLWSLYTLKRQDDILGPLTTMEETKTAIDEGTPARIAELDARIKVFAADCKSGEKTTLRLVPEDLNLMLTMFRSLQPYRGLVSFREIGDGGLIAADFALPMNQMRFWKGQRYLVGDGHLKLSYEPDEFRLYLVLHDLAVRDEPVPQGFLFNFEHWLWLTPYYEDDTIRESLLQITGVRFGGNAVTLLANGAEIDEPAETQKNPPFSL